MRMLAVEAPVALAMVLAMVLWSGHAAGAQCVPRSCDGAALKRAIHCFSPAGTCTIDSGPGPFGSTTWCWQNGAKVLEGDGPSQSNIGYYGPNGKRCLRELLGEGSGHSLRAHGMSWRYDGQTLHCPNGRRFRMTEDPLVSPDCGLSLPACAIGTCP
jgi:hypothetical protein